MLCCSCQGELVASKDLGHLVRVLGADTKLCLLAGCDDLLAVACANAWIEADHDLSAGVQPSVEVELGEGVHADEQIVGNGILHLRRGNVVGDVEDIALVKASQKVHVQLARAHGVNGQSFLADDGEKGRVGIGLCGIVDRKAPCLAHGDELTASLAQNFFAVDVEGGAKFLDQGAGGALAKEVDGISVAGTDTRHCLASDLFRTLLNIWIFSGEGRKVDPARALCQEAFLSRFGPAVPCLAPVCPKDEKGRADFQSALPGAIVFTAFSGPFCRFFAAFSGSCEAGSFAL